jgi:hypothetical protein
MFTQNAPEVKKDLATKQPEDESSINKYKNILNPYQPSTIQQSEINYNTIDQLLEKEKQHNKTETWNKLDKTMKKQKLHAYAEHYGQEQSMAVRDIKKLKAFFSDCLDKGKLSKTKDVSYNKEKREIEDMPALLYTASTQHFSLRNIDNKYISTLKSMTPKRIISAPSLADLENGKVSATP